MTNIKATKRALGSSVLALFLCFAMLLGTTFAWFTDTVTSANNIITAGNLDVELEYAKVKDGEIVKDGNEIKWTSVQGSSEVFDPDALWEPGRVEIVYLKVSNLGTLDLKYQLGVNVYSETPGVNVNDKTFKLSEHLVFKVVEMPDAITTYTDREAVAVAAGTEMGLKDYNGKTTALTAKNGGNDVDYLALIVYMPETVGNEANYRGEDVPYIKLGVDLFATQYTSEKDSFGDDYDADANEGFKVTTGADLQAAINNAKPGDVIEIGNDIVIDEAIVIPASASTYSMRAANDAVVINLNGKTITGNMHKNVGAVIKNEGNLVIKNGTISSTADNGGSAIMNNGTLIVENVTLNGAPNADGSWPSYTVNNTGVMTVKNSKITSYHGAVASYGEGALVTLNNSEIDMSGIPGFTSHGIYTYNDGKVIVNGGTYANKATDQSASGASVINGNVEINGGTFTGRIENYYGTPVIYGGTFYDSNVKKYIAKDHQVTKVGDVYIVTAETTKVVTNADELKAALAAGQDVLFANDITVAASEGGYSKAGIVVNKGQIVDGNGYTLTVTGAGDTWSCAIYLTNGTIKNITVAGVMRGVFTAGQSADLYLDNVTFKNVVYTFNSDDGNTDYTIYISNCDMNGWTSHSDVHKEVVYTNCNFGKGSGYAYCRPYGPTKFVNCTFSAGYTVDTTQTTEITFDNCTWVVTSLSALQNKLNEAKAGTTTILLDADIAGDVTVEQKADVKIIIDGNGKTFAGTITVDGKSARYETAGLTIKNVNFNAKDISADAYINLGKEGDVNNTRYTNNVTVEDCTFKGYGDNEVDGAVAVKSYTGGDWNLTIDGCTVYAGMHSMLQVQNVETGLEIVDCKVYSKNGVNLNSTPSVEMSDCEFDVKGYAVRYGVDGSTVSGNFEIKDSTLKSANDDGDAVIIFRGTMTGSTLTLSNTTLKGTPEITGNANVVRN